MSHFSLPTGRAGTPAAAAGDAAAAATALSPAAQQALHGATTLGAVNPAQLTAEIKRASGDAHRQQALLAELAPHLAAGDVADVRRQLGGKPVVDADLALDLTQIALDIVGIVEPTPFADGANTLISLGRGDLLGAGLSAVGMVPYIGDAAKLGKLGKYAQTVAKATQAARANPALRQTFAPAIEKIGAALAALPTQKLPAAARAQIETLKALTATFAKDGKAAGQSALRGADAAAGAAAGAAKPVPTPTQATARTAAAASRVGAQPLWGRYLKDIQQQTGLAVSPKQLPLIEAALKKTEFTRLTPAETKVHRDAFNKVKNTLIAEWEKHTGQKWPRYTEDLVSKNGTITRRAGQPYDAHHIIENSYAGPNEWWNMHPARFPDQHQNGIHRAGGPGAQIFK